MQKTFRRARRYLCKSARQPHSPAWPATCNGRLPARLRAGRETGSPPRFWRPEGENGNRGLVLELHIPDKAVAPFRNAEVNLRERNSISRTGLQVFTQASMLPQLKSA